jgi:hypothetical protein
MKALRVLVFSFSLSSVIAVFAFPSMADSFHHLAISRFSQPLAVAGAAKGDLFKGEITDEHLNCIQTPMKATEGVDDRESCVLYWAHFVQPASKYVLYDAATKKTYQLDDQMMVQPFAGRKVEVTGTFTESTNSIHVTDIKPM